MNSVTNERAILPILPSRTFQAEPDKTVLMLSAQYLPNLGGVETALRAFASALTRQNQRVTLITLRPLAVDRPWKSFERNGLFTIIRVWVPKFGGFWNRIGSYPKTQFLYHSFPLFVVAFIYLLFSSRRVSLINAHGFVPGIVGTWLKILFRKPLVISLHSVLKVVYLDLQQADGIALSLIRSSLDSANHIKVASDAGVEELVWLGIDQSKVSRLVYPIDIDTYQPLPQSQCRADLGIDRQPTILFVGRLTEGKGIRLLMRLAERLPEMNFLVVGEGPLEQFVRKRSGALTNLRFWGFASDAELVKLYNAADILVVPSQEPEGIPMVTMEAISCGTPLVVTNLGGLAQYRDCPAVIVCDPSESSLADALIQMKARLDASAAQLREQARAYALTRFANYSFENLIGVRLADVREKSD